MSCLQNEILLEQCYERAYDRFKTFNKLTEDMMQELMLHKGVADCIEKNARQMFEDMCQ